MSEKTEYITRAEALLALDSAITAQDVFDSISEIPAADVEPVVWARWQDGKCTNCDCFGFPRPDGSNEYTIRCPNCGAHTERSGSGERDWRNSHE